MERKRIGARLEDRSVFLRRLYCDQTCMGMAQRKGAPSRDAYRKRARRLRGSSCEVCGRTERLSLHHKDRNWSNNDPSNLQTLCASCHTSLHHEAGHISPRRTPPPCEVCGKPSYRRALCSTHLTRWKRYGDPRLTKRKLDGRWTLLRE